ncbi:hypothetical protein ACVRY7_06475 [Streptococcus ictaluri]|uniref:Uncharacterized protein n=1 Tax=Streptococcus ictaluri 707-05 TaxID=764299 RepID=G5K513_9STRE|nr:hypothetical protein [Streptococcus ictaluri]EHI68977.1 hypothetical protein STRIC_1900 [Streptococcus ictaluri 707-05]
MKKTTTEKQSLTTKFVKLGLVSAMFTGGALLALLASASTYTDYDYDAAYRNAQTAELPEYITGSIYGILNQNSSVTYPKDIDGAQPVA